MVGPKAIIHLDRLAHNYRTISDQINNTPIMAIVKANGYGHGAVPVAKILQNEGARYLGVFAFEEAIELRDNGITADIFLLSRLQPDFLEYAVENKITVILSAPEDIRILNEFYQETGLRVKVHLKIDTGMTRLGIPFDIVEKVLESVMLSRGINCEGIYSHFATADEGDLRYAKHQLTQFEEVLDLAAKLGLKFKFRHCSNSGAILNLPESRYDLVRVGMLLYGAYPSDEVPTNLPIEPVMAFKAPIVMVRRVPKGTFVSYGGKYQTVRDTNIGVAQVGFADGFPRSWYENGFILYKGEKYNIAGRVCMDQLTIDFEDTVPETGEEVLLFGKHGEDLLKVEEIANSIGSTVYVLLTAISGRTRRIYTGSNLD
jgi:alanine racemase